MYDKSNYDEKEKARQILNNALLMHYHVPVSMPEDEQEDSKPRDGISKRIRHVVAVVSNLITK